MKLYYFTQVKPDDVGVYKKKVFQEKSFLKNGIDLKKTYCKLKKNSYEYYIEKYKIGEESYKYKLDFIRRRLFQKIKIYKNIQKIIKIYDIKVIYIRYYRSDYYFYIFLKNLKKNNTKIIIEIPTYPYDNEVRKSNISLLLDKYYRKKLYKYVDRVVTYSDDKKIWNIPCINISNGIDLEEVHLVNKKEKNKNKIVFTIVSNCSFWHGIDRMLYSLEEYGKNANKKEIIFNVVGEGNEINKLKEIVIKSKNLLKVVKFTGIKVGKELEEIYDQTDIAIGSLGRHRSGVDTMRALKNREYCAVGLPMIFSEDDPDLRKVPFVYHISKNEKLIDIQELLKWYENLKISPEEIRKYAEEFTWDKQMKKVIDEIEKI